MRRSTYLNPVHNRPCPDPFVLKHLGEYWCYSTGFWHDGRCFGVMHSRDLVEWRELAGAMEPFAEGHTCYWAPEVTYYKGHFFLYYSVGNEERMQVRVALADDPAGPFVDSGRGLTAEDFAIDPHVFEDADGARYLFYATDFLTHTHIGTGTVVDRMIDPFTLAGSPRPVTRPRYDWQVYDPKRAEKGGVRWHTVEGPFVLRRKDTYYEMFSGGNWKNITYGVSYAVARDINTQDEWAQASDGERVLPILRTVPGKVIGPGHNSVVRGPDNLQLFCVYHRWAEDSSNRVLAIDRQDWAGERMIILGPSTAEQPAPLPPAFADFFDRGHVDGLGGGWRCAGGRWSAVDKEARQESSDSLAEARLEVDASCFVLEVGLRALPEFDEAGAFGISLRNEDDECLRLMLQPAKNRAILTVRDEAGLTDLTLNLPEDFKAGAYHLLRVEADGRRVCVALDGAAITPWRGRVATEPKAVALVTRHMGAAFAGFALTVGWQDLFDNGINDWRPLEPGADARVDDYQLWLSDAREGDTAASTPERLAAIAKGPALEAYEVVVNARLDEPRGPGACYGFYPALGGGKTGPLFTVERDAGGWSLFAHTPSARQAFPLPGGFDPHVYQQFRLIKEHRRLTILWEAQVLGEVEAPVEPTRVGLFARDSTAAFDMVRVTAIIGKM
ncbi:MAG: glycoside hydrolase family 43 protein [Blastocatellia bacterium]